MKANKIIHTIDSHTGGEPTRLIVSGIPLKGRSLLEQRDYMGFVQRNAVVDLPRR